MGNTEGGIGAGAANAGWAIPADTSEAITTAAAAIMRFEFLMSTGQAASGAGPCAGEPISKGSGSGGWGRHPPLPRTCAFLSVRRLAPT